MNPKTPFKIAASKNIDHDHVNALTLLYLPIIGVDAYTLYMTLTSLVERSRLRSPSYPHALLLDVLDMAKQRFDQARNKLEACGLLETHVGEEDAVYSMFLPLSADMFIKDSPFAPYLLKTVGQQRFDELTELFRVRRPRLSGYENVSADFDDVFTPAYEPMTTQGTYVAPRRKDPRVNHDFSIETVLDALPKTIVDETLTTTRVKERLTEIAYVYALDVEAMTDVIKSSITAQGNITLADVVNAAQKRYQAQPKHRFTKKTSGYNLDYFKSTHPKTVVEDLTGMHVPASDLKVIDRLITETGMTLEVINVLIAYVLKELDNRFPVYNYFEKVVAEWKRSTIETADDAIAHIKKRIQRKKQPRPTTRRGKTLPKDVQVDWFDDYLKAQSKEE